MIPGLGLKGLRRNAATLRVARLSEFRSRIPVSKGRMVAAIAFGLCCAPGLARAAQVIADELIVQGRACIGLDCVNNESFGFNTLRLKENNTRIEFVDTSIVPGFPNTSWLLQANDSNSGGSNFIGIVDQTSNAFVMKLCSVLDSSCARSVALGNSTVNGTGSLAIGAGNTVTGNNSGAFGTNNTINGTGTFVVGDPNVVNGNNTFVTGNNNTVNGPNVAGSGDNIQIVGSNNTVASTANASGSSILGSNNTVNAVNAIAIGNSATVTGNSAIAMGNNAQAAFANSVAIGNGAVTTRANQQVFGTAATTYTMPGITSAASRAAQSGPVQVVTTDAAGNLATASLVTNQDIAGLNSQLATINGRLSDLSQKALTGVAMAFAMAGAPTLMPNEKVALTVNYGTYQGAHGVALGGALRISDKLQANGGIAYGPDGNLAGGRAGLRIGW
jgi:hypothetical protein